MARNTRIVVGTIAVVIGLLLLVSYWGRGDRETTTDTFADVAALEFDVDNGPVTVVAGNGELTVESTVSTGFLGGDSTVEQDGDTLRIEHDCPPIFGWGCNASFDVVAPEEILVSGTTSNGPVAVESITGPVDVETSNGAIALHDLVSDVTADTSNGAVVGTELSSGEIDVSTSNGQISLEFEAAPNSVRARSSNGRVQIVLPSDAPPFAVDTSTSNGQVSTEVRSDPSAPDTIDIETSNGDITIRYDE